MVVNALLAEMITTLSIVLVAGLGMGLGALLDGRQRDMIEVTR